MQKQLILIIAADHRGFHMKHVIKERFELPEHTITWIDVGAFDAERSDYPVFAHDAIVKMHEHPTAHTIMICGTGIGMAIAANRYKGIYAAVTWNAEVARLAKEDDNANVLVLPADYVSEQEGFECITAWLKAEFKHGRYAQRLVLIDQLIK